MGTITLLTDFGIKDGNVGVMKGVIWKIAPQAQIADLSHLIGPQNVREAALIVARSAPYFPSGTVHVAVVDPGVGTERRPLAASLGDQFFVGPDNGVFTLVLERAEKEGAPVMCIHLDRPEFWLPAVSYVFHGRDIFAPVAAYLAAGVSITELGTPISDPLRLVLPQPVRSGKMWKGELIHVDHFGNLSSNMRLEHLGSIRAATVRLCGREIKGLVRTFGERAPGELVALFGSSGNLIVSVVNGNAAAELGAHVGDVVEVEVAE